MMLIAIYTSKALYRTVISKDDFAYIRPRYKVMMKIVE